MITNANSGTRIDEIADGIYRISTPVTVIPGGFTFNQYLIVDDEPLLFHTGADECGALNEFSRRCPKRRPALRRGRGPRLNRRCSRPGSSRDG